MNRELDSWLILDSGKAIPVDNMRSDYDKLLNLTSSSQPILRFYDWVDSAATHGYFVDPWQYLDKSAALAFGLHLARRPTGGGLLFHGCDLAFSLLIPAHHSLYSLNTLDHYAYVNDRLSKAIQAWDGCLKLEKFTQSKKERVAFCMVAPTHYDLVIEGRKVAGGAQRKTKQGLLHQGSLCLSLPSKALKPLFKPGLDFLEQMRESSYPLIPSMERDKIAALKQQLIHSFTT